MSTSIQDRCVTTEPSTRLVLITPTLAKQYLLQNKDNRKLRAPIIKKYASFMEKGEWILNDQSISFDVNGRLLNGQHRLNAVILSGITIKSFVTRNLPEDSFKYLDVGASRSQGDIHKMSKYCAALISSFHQITWKRDCTFTQINNARNYLLSSMNDRAITIEDLMDNRLCRTKKKIISSSISVLCLVYWIDKTGRDDVLLPFYEELINCSSSYENRRSLNSRGLAFLKQIETRKVGSWDRQLLCRTALSLYDPQKLHMKLLVPAGDEEFVGLRDWCLKVLGA